MKITHALVLIAFGFTAACGGAPESDDPDEVPDVSTPEITPQSGNSYPSGCMCNYTFHVVVCKDLDTRQWVIAKNLGGC